MNARTLIGVLLALAASAALSADSQQVFEGSIPQITLDLVVVETSDSVHHRFKLDGNSAQCFFKESIRTSCAVLAEIGYADKARVTVVGDDVQRINILQLEQ